MQNDTILQHHQKCKEIIEAINHILKRIKIYEDSNKGIGGIYFISLREKNDHNIEILKMCIKRLEQRYNNNLKQLTEF